MSETKELLNNIRVHMRDIPEFFSKQLKQFIVKQPDMNLDLSTKIEKAGKAMEAIQQKLAELDRNQSQMAEEIKQLKSSKGRG